ncbi:hypothetical protein [Pseudomonas sp. R1-15]|uniref:glycine-rich domain-containing protein n=1 Tax=Pseudomonas sp. R1-15 TaxID=2817399 RepID=UPI003DA9EC29
MDYPKSVPSAGLVAGKFVDEDPIRGTPGSLIPSQWGNGVTSEILNVIEAAGLTPAEDNNAQLLAAIKGVVGAGRLINIQMFKVSGTFPYMPTPGTKSIMVEIVGGGGGSGGVAATASNTVAASSGGGSAAYAKSLIMSGFSGAQVIVGAGGSAGAAGNNNGGVGGTSSFGSMMSAPGGKPGNGSAAYAAATGTGGSGVSDPPVGANIVGFGGAGSDTSTILPTAIFRPSSGGGNPLGSGGVRPTSAIPGAISGTGYGSGPSGTFAGTSTAAQPGATGQSGAVIIYEYS